MVNLFDPTWDAEVGEPEAKLRAVRLARPAGASRLAANLYELEPGAIVSPLHFHHANEELLFVFSGTPTLRRGGGDERQLDSRRRSQKRPRSVTEAGHRSIGGRWSAEHCGGLPIGVSQIKIVLPGHAIAADLPCTGDGLSVVAERASGAVSRL